jgi:hypothetical protein
MPIGRHFQAEAETYRSYIRQSGNKEGSPSKAFIHDAYKEGYYSWHAPGVPMKGHRRVSA